MAVLNAESADALETEAQKIERLELENTEAKRSFAQMEAHIEGLRERNEADNKGLRKENEDLRSRLDALEKDLVKAKRAKAKEEKQQPDEVLALGSPYCDSSVSVALDMGYLASDTSSVSASSGC